MQVFRHLLKDSLTVSFVEGWAEVSVVCQRLTFVCGADKCASVDKVCVVFLPFSFPLYFKVTLMIHYDPQVSILSIQTIPKGHCFAFSEGSIYSNFLLIFYDDSEYVCTTWLICRDLIIASADPVSCMCFHSVRPIGVLCRGLADFLCCIKFLFWKEVDDDDSCILKVAQIFSLSILAEKSKFHKSFCWMIWNQCVTFLVRESSSVYTPTYLCTGFG